MKRIAALLIAVVVLSSLCTTKYMRSITIDNQTYVFDYNLFETIKINSTDEAQIRNLIRNSDTICLDFYPSTNDTPIYQVVAYNTVFRLTRYFSLKGMKKNFTMCNQEPKIYFIGPSSANKTNVHLANRTIVVEGTSIKKFEEASDKLVLIVFDIDEERLKELWLLRGHK